jgi:hypothetical protein
VVFTNTTTSKASSSRIETKHSAEVNTKTPIVRELAY